MAYLCKRDIKALALGFERRKGQSLGEGELPPELIKALVDEGAIVAVEGAPPPDDAPQSVRKPKGKKAVSDDKTD
jgi:hypothetical protein